MAHANPLNVYKGKDGLRNYFDPDAQPPLPLVELPEKLNPFYKDKVRIYAKMLTVLPAQNVKALPALNMLLHDPSAAGKSIIEASSGSTCTSLSMSARVLYDNNDTTAFISNKTEMNRIRQLQFFGLKVALYGGPAQPEITDPRGIIIRAQEMVKSSPGEILNPGQYDNVHNWKSHIRWTGPQLWKQIPEINVFCMGMGSAGCVTGTGSYLKEKKPSVKVVGVCNAVNDPVPGPRPFPLFDSCQFPWREMVDKVEISSSVDSYRLSMQLSREGLVCGPSTGMALKGLFTWLENVKAAGELDQYREPDTGDLNCVFVCCDLPQQYMQGYFARLSPEDFRPIQNEELLTFDTDKYDLKWELTPREALTVFHGLPDAPHPPSTNPSSSPHSSSFPPYSSSGSNSTSTTFQSGRSALTSIPPHRWHNPFILDLRQPTSPHVPSPFFFFSTSSQTLKIHSSPLAGLTAHTPNPLADLTSTAELRAQWTALKAKFSGADAATEAVLARKPPESVLLVLCYQGETSRIATAVLRARGLEAFSVRGGAEALAALAVRGEELVGREGQGAKEEELVGKGQGPPEEEEEVEVAVVGGEPQPDPISGDGMRKRERGDRHHVPRTAVTA